MPEIRRLFNEISPTYDKLNHLLSLGRDLAWRKQAVALLPWPDTTTLRVLDLCAGTLDFGLVLAKRYKAAHIEGLDFSLAMLKEGKRKIPPALKARYPLVCADAHVLPFKDQRFDLVLCAYGMRNLPEETLALREITRVLKPQGLVGILEFFTPETLLTQIFYKTYLAHFLPKLGGWISGHRDAYEYLYRSIQSYHTLSEYLKFLNFNGIKVYNKKAFILKICYFILGMKQ